MISLHFYCYTLNNYKNGSVFRNVGFDNIPLLPQSLCISSACSGRKYPDLCYKRAGRERFVYRKEYVHPFKITPLLSVSQGMEEALNIIIL